jgi:hypothetical protein
MAGIMTILNTATTEANEDLFLVLSSRIKRNPHTTAFIPDVEAFRAKIDAVRAEERGLLEAESLAAAGVQFADQELDTSVDFVSDNTERKSLLRSRLFGDLRPSELKKPTLGDQLQAMTAWPEVLAKSEKDVLVAHAPVVAQRVEAGLAAASEKKTASDNLANFRAVGARRKLNEEHNAFRKSLYGKLGEIQHAKKLPAGWAESFFQQSSSEDLSVSDLDRKIGAAEAEVVALKKQRAALVAEEAESAAVRAEASRKVKQAKLAALTKAKDELEAKAAALQAEIDQDGPPIGGAGG